MDKKIEAVQVSMDRPDDLQSLAAGLIGIETSTAQLPANTEDECWVQALSEANGSGRGTGLWAKCFAETVGNENQAAALYTGKRASQLIAELAVRKTQQLEKNADLETEVGALHDKFLRGNHLGISEVVQLVRFIPFRPEWALSADRVRGNTLLHLSAVYGLTDEVEALIKWGARLDARNGSAQIPADRVNNDAMRELLLTRMRSTPPTGISPLSVAAAPTIEAVPNSTSGSKSSSLLQRARGGQVSMGKLFWLYGAVPSAIFNVLGASPLVDGLGSMFGLLFVMFCWAAWVLPALWESASVYKGGNASAVAVKVVVVLNWLTLALTLMVLIKASAQN